VAVHGTMYEHCVRVWGTHKTRQDQDKT